MTGSFFVSAMLLACVMVGTKAIPSIESFGSFVNSMVPEAEGKNVTMVAGNMAGDADSIITALTYAYLLHNDNEDILGGSEPVAFQRFAREDMPMRAETEKILKNSGINPSDLLFKDDASAADLLSNMTQVVLTDHNSAVEVLVPYGDSVIQIFDHHTDLGDHAHVVGDDRDIAFDEIAKAATAASACTVICEQYLKHEHGRELLALDDAAVALALLSVILIDGSNKLVSEGGKLTPRDMECLDVLQNITQLSDPNMTSLYEELNAAKKNQTMWEDKSAAQILRYDLKNYRSTDGKRKAGISSSLVSLEDLLAKEDWVDSLLERRADYDIFLVMTKMTKEDGSKGKEIFFSSCDEELVSDAEEFFTLYDDGLLQLEPLGAAEIIPHPSYSIAVDQTNTSPSRKQVGPITEEFLDTLTDSPDCAVTSSSLEKSNIFS